MDTTADYKALYLKKFFQWQDICHRQSINIEELKKEITELKEKIKKREELIQCLGSNIDELDVKKSVLIIENNKLRGLLKECKEELEYHSELIFCELESDNSKIEFKHLLTRINAILGESEEK